MILTVFILQIFLFVFLLKATNFSKNYFNVSYSLLYFNYFYFFILWWSWYIVDKNYIYKFITGYYLASIYSLGIFVGILIKNKTLMAISLKASRMYPKMTYIEEISAKKLFAILMFLLLIAVFAIAHIFKSIDPIYILIKVNAAAISGELYQNKIMLLIRLYFMITNIIFCFLVLGVYGRNNGNGFYMIVISIVCYAFVAFCIGSKSNVIFPFLYTLWIRHSFFKKIKLGYLVGFTIIFIICIALLQIIRQNMFFLFKDWLNSLLFIIAERIDMPFYLTKFYEKGFYGLEYSNSLVGVLSYFIPRSIFEFFGAEKPTLFSLSFVRYVMDDDSLYRSVAGSGIAEWINNVIIFHSSTIIYVSIVFCGIVSVLLAKIIFYLSEISIKNKQYLVFVSIIILVQTGVFFEFAIIKSIGFLENTILFIISIYILNKISKFLYKKESGHL